jgi:membrane-associated PAP2 superfamily phosphatase
MSMTSRNKPLALFIWIGLIGLIVTLALEVWTPMDLWLQDHFYHFSTEQWLVDPRAPGPRFWFYNLAKILLIAFGSLLLLRAFNLKWAARILPMERKDAIYALVCLGGIPLLIGLGKNISHVHCPSELLRYGGTEEYHRVLDFHTSYNKVRPHCFPAGHASGGFALFGLYFIRRKPGMLCVGMIYGWVMGLYQMFKGAHFLSHTLFTMFFALLFAAAAARFFYQTTPPETQ